MHESAFYIFFKHSHTKNVSNLVKSQIFMLMIYDQEQVRKLMFKKFIYLGDVTKKELQKDVLGGGGVMLIFFFSKKHDIS